jgi:hypothetical protein
MALPQLTIAKNWFTGTTVREVNWDNIRTPLILWAAGINGSITQISRDAFGSGYVINQNGAAILSKSLAQQIADISTGTTPFSGHIKIYNGFDFLMYSDAGVTLKFGIDGATGNTFLYGGGDLSLFSGGDIFTYSDVGVTPTFSVDGSTGSFGIPSGQKFFLDGTDLLGDTYIYEGAANDIYFTAGGEVNLLINDTRVTVGGEADLIIQPTKLLYLDGGTNTYITEDSSDNIAFFSAGVNSFNISSARAYAKADVWLDTTLKLYLDGGSNTYISESSADNIVFFSNATESFNISSARAYARTDVWLDTTKRLYFDGGNNTYAYESAADTLDVVTGGVLSCEFTSNGILLPDVDPPAANYANRNSLIKVWVSASSTGGLVGSLNGAYNVTTVDDDGTGTKGINFDLDFVDTVAPILTMGSFANKVFGVVNTKGTSGIEIFIYDDTGALADSSIFCIVEGKQ